MGDDRFLWNTDAMTALGAVGIFAKKVFFSTGEKRAFYMDIARPLIEGIALSLAPACGTDLMRELQDALARRVKLYGQLASGADSRGEQPNFRTPWSQSFAFSSSDWGAVQDFGFSSNKMSNGRFAPRTAGRIISLGKLLTSRHAVSWLSK